MNDFMSWCIQLAWIKDSPEGVDLNIYVCVCVCLCVCVCGLT